VTVYKGDIANRGKGMMMVKVPDQSND
jgi:hypothetical protein